ncbi:MAG: DUF3159 domain-containing protein [Actinobacteria bacterium]|nr:DUF3159 domain-containing protein [Actinomycetota bacterium]
MTQPHSAQADGGEQHPDADAAGAPLRHPFSTLLGGVRGAMESILPPLVFITVYLGLGGSAETDLGWAIGAAVVLAVGFTIWRLLERKHPARALASLLLVLVSAYIASRTGSAADFFWPRVLLNVASALAFVVANLIRWPLIGVVLGPLVGTKMSWRKDPDLVRAYTWASWPWAVLNAVRAALLAFFIDGNQLWALAASGAFFYGLTIVTIGASWWLIRRALPGDHAGVRHPRFEPADGSDAQSG